MLSEYPKFRDDLIVSRSGQADTESFIIKDPVTGKIFQCREAECFIARQLDGRTPPSEVPARFERKFGVALTMERLEQFIERLRALCLLDEALSDGELLRQQRRVTMERSPLKRALFLKLPAVDPDAFFDAIVPRIRFLFTKRFVFLTCALTAVAIAIAVVDWQAYKDQIARLLHPGTIVTFVLVAIAVTVAHECAHGLTCKHYGGQVHEIGFLLIYFMPAFYCNVSDAWLFKEKKKRIWVSFAGVFFQTFMWALATIVWRIVDRGTWLSDFCCLTMATSGLTNFFNLNPLIKLDGYYMLADYLAVPNLRKKAFEYIGTRARNTFLPGSRNAKTVSARERRIYLMYGILAGAYSLALLLFILFKIASWVIARFHAAGLFVLAGIVLLIAMGSLEQWTANVYGTPKEGKSRSGERDGAGKDRA
jgi:putative peptide zinc metalloprotease protein